MRDYTFWYPQIGVIICLLIFLVLFLQRGIRTQSTVVYILMNLTESALNAVMLLFWYFGDTAARIPLLYLCSALNIAVMCEFAYYMNTLMSVSRMKNRRLRNGLVAAGAGLIFFEMICRIPLAGDGTDIVLDGGYGIVMWSMSSMVFIILTIVTGGLSAPYLTGRIKQQLCLTFVFCVAAVMTTIISGTDVQFAFLMTMTTLFLLMTLQAQTSFIEPETRLPNYHEFIREFAICVREEKTVSVVLIRIRDILSAQYNGVLTEQAARDFTSALRRLSAGRLFRLRNHLFAVAIPEQQGENPGQFIRQLEETADSGIPSASGSFRVLLMTCMIEIPADVWQPDDMNLLLDKFMDYDPEGSRECIAVTDLNLPGEREIQSKERAVLRALNENRMELWFQPILNTKTGRFDSAEGLIRMRGEDGKIIMPGRFIPAAEASGSIVRIDSFVREAACSFLASEDRKRLGVRYVEINLSAEGTMQENLSSLISDVLERYHVERSALNLEITESAGADIRASMLRNIRILHEQGTPLSLDDFGTGYSGLARMMTIPFSFVKMDRSLLLTAMESSDGRKTFLHMADMLHHLGFEIVCEGVETEEQKELVMAAGIEHIQGFMYSKPLCREDYIRFLEEHSA